MSSGAPSIAVFAPLATAERRLLTHVDLPVGTSLVVLATR